VHYDSSRSSKVNDSHVTWQGVCHFLLVINSNLGPFSHRFRDMAGFPLNFLPTLHSTPNLKMFPFAADCWNFASRVSYNDSSIIPSVHTIRLISRRQQAKCCCPHEADQTICSCGNPDDASNDICYDNNGNTSHYTFTVALVNTAWATGAWQLLAQPTLANL